MIIPDKVHLCGREITTIAGTEQMRVGREIGMADFVTGTIAVGVMCGDGLVPAQLREQTYFHELVHHCMNVMGREDLNEDEAFVDVLGSLLHQALKPHMKDGR